jgi:hypothetical protein
MVLITAGSSVLLQQKLLMCIPCPSKSVNGRIGAYMISIIVKQAIQTGKGLAACHNVILMYHTLKKAILSYLYDNL